MFHQLKNTDRTFWLQRKTIILPLLASLALFAVLPTVAGLSWLLGEMVFFACHAIAIALAIAAGGMVIAGVCMLFGDEGGAGFLAIIGGVIVGGIWTKVKTPLTTFGIGTREDLSTFGEKVAWFFLDWKIYLYSWSPGAAVLGIATLVLLTIGGLLLVPSLRFIFLKGRGACNKCDYVGDLCYACPHCEEIIAGLKPSTWGVFNRDCPKCRHPLQTVGLLGRKDYDSYCGNEGCELSYKGHQEVPVAMKAEYYFGMIGAQNSGKTTYMIAAVAELMKHSPRLSGLSFSILSSDDREYLKRCLDELEGGRALDKTRLQEVPPALRVEMEFAENGEDQRMAGSSVFLYDVAGESFESSDDRALHYFNKRLDGLLFFIDIAKEPDELTTDLSALQGEIHSLEDHLNVRARRKIHIPISVIASKADQTEGFHPVADTKLLPDQGTPPRELIEQSHLESEKVRDRLLQEGFGEVVAELEERFRSIDYAATRLKPPSGPIRYQPMGYLSSFLAVLDRAGALTDHNLKFVLKNAGHTFMRSLKGLEGNKARGIAITTILVGVGTVSGLLCYLLT